ncbi:MAG: EAL domain-containing protein [Actinomycetota bacterium]|nr:EAL domain-containing protein [Actinomycetota bacterium]
MTGRIGTEDLVGVLDDDRGDAMVLFSPDGLVVYASRSLRSMTGVDPSSLVGHSSREFVHPEDRSTASATQEAAMASSVPAVGNYRLRCADGSFLWVESLVKQVDDPAQAGRVLLCSWIRDISDRKSLEARSEAEAAQRELTVQELAKSERRLAEAQTIGGIGSWEYDLVTETFTWSDELCRIYGVPIGVPLTPDEVVSMTHVDDRDQFGQTLLTGLERYETYEIDHRIVRADGRERIVHTRGGFEVDEDGEPVMMRGTVQDVTDARRSEIEARRSAAALRVANVRLRQLATTDALTGLPNRALFDDRLEQALALGYREERKVAVLYLDLDRFKEVNDSLGHHGGDALLVDVAARLVGVLRASDTAARLGGDEFAVLLSAPNLARHAATTAERILDSLRSSFTTYGVEFFATASIGIALWPDDSPTKAELLRHADMAMYRAKRAGGDRFEMFRPTMTVAARDRLSLDAELRRATDSGEFFLRYHPQIDLATGRVVAVEALLRWAHPTRGEVTPSEFVPLAEETGLIVAIGKQVLTEACRQAARWADAISDRAPLRMAVNVGQRQLAEPGFATLVSDTLAHAGVPASTVELEITESALISESGPAVTNLHSLRTVGVGLAIDDFGTGYSSLAYLRRFPVNRLKIDMSFVAGLGHVDRAEDSGARALVSAAISLAHALGLEAVAEGVETEHQRTFLEAAGCDQAQGFLWTEPLLPDEVIVWLDADTTRRS